MSNEKETFRISVPVSRRSKKKKGTLRISTRERENFPIIWFKVKKLETVGSEGLQKTPRKWYRRGVVVRIITIN